MSDLSKLERQMHVMVSMENATSSNNVFRQLKLNDLLEKYHQRPVSSNPAFSKRELRRMLHQYEVDLAA